MAGLAVRTHLELHRLPARSPSPASSTSSTSSTPSDLQDPIHLPSPVRHTHSPALIIAPAHSPSIYTTEAQQHSRQDLHDSRQDFHETLHSRPELRESRPSSGTGYHSRPSSRQDLHDSRYQYEHSPVRKIKAEPHFSHSTPLAPMVAPQDLLQTPPGHRSLPIKRNFSETAVQGSFMSSQQAMYSPAMLMMAQLAGSASLGSLPYPFMFGGLPVAAVKPSQPSKVKCDDGAPLDLSSLEVPAKKARRTPSPRREEPLNLSFSHNRESYDVKKENFMNGQTWQTHMEELVKRQLSGKEALQLQELLYYEHTVLVSQLSQRSEVEGNAGSFQRLHHIYMVEVERIEKERYKCLMNNNTANDQQRQTMLTLYDQKYLEASEFLQNVVFISLPLTEEEKIERFGTLSQLYAQVGMQRKSAFFKRVAAMQCVSPQNPNPSWLHCYQLLLQTLDGYKLSLDPKEMPQDECYGWPLVQLRVLHELIYSARRMGNPAIAVRHLTLLLHVMFDYLTTQERQEMASVLESYTVKCEGTPHALALDNGVILPPVPLTKLPTVRSLKLENLAPHLRPVKLRYKESPVKENNSPFIYSPLQLSTRTTTDTSKMEFQWVEGEICNVTLQVINPMPIELKITNLCLMVEGVEFEAFPTSISLPAESGPVPIKLHGMAKKPGSLTILGYTSCVLGVRSNCRLRLLPHIKENSYEVQVVGCLPQVLITTSLPKAISFSSLANSASAITSANANLYAGQNCECLVTITNNGNESIDVMDISIDSKIQPGLLGKVVDWNTEELTSQLPLAANSQAVLTLHIHGTSDFLPTQQTEAGGGLSPASRAKRWFATELADSDIEDDCDAVIIEALLKLQYSGGPGMADGFCRQCSVAMLVEIQPSIVFQRWDVLPHTKEDYCHMVFDLENTSSNDIEVTYGENCTALVEGKQIKRVVMELERILIPEFADVPLEPRSKYMEGCQVTRHDMYSQHVAGFVDIRWDMRDTDHHGTLSIERLRWTDEQLRLIQASPIRWELQVQGATCVGSVSATVGQPLTVTCNLTNRQVESIEDAVLQVSCYCDLENGARQSHLEGTLVVMGQLRTSLQIIAPNCKCSHEVAFMFLHTGRYKLDATCAGLRGNTREAKIWKHTPTLEIIVDSPS